MSAATVAPRRRGRRRVQWAGLWFAAPFMAVFAVAVLAPLGYALYLMLFQERLVGGTVFVGAENLWNAFTDARLLEGLRRVALFLLVQVPIMLGLALLAALALDSGLLRFARVFRVGIFVPYAIPSVVAALMWGFMYGDEFGLVADLEGLLGVPMPDLLAGPWLLPAIGNIVTWEFVGYNMLILYAALRAVPTELYEAADIDGAGEIRKAVAIKLPALRGAIGVALLFSIIGSFQLFNEPNVLRAISPAVSTYYTPNMYAYNLAFNGQQFNYSAAVAVVLALATIAVAYVAQLVTARGQR
ncbi:carbohydrate ABC transporter permease [Marinactinospora rubrisoli]|uniref:Carbohydrate ABC transporter permease n=1 Tax=Marinactinospora rubrisoli TaxID=2715399 RepID=A0ABW2KB37_9ACTN